MLSTKKYSHNHSQEAERDFIELPPQRTYNTDQQKKKKGGRITSTTKQKSQKDITCFFYLPIVQSKRLSHQRLHLAPTKDMSKGNDVSNGLCQIKGCTS